MPVITQDQVDQASDGGSSDESDEIKRAMGVAVMNQMNQAAMGVMIRMKNRRTVDHGQRLILFQLFLYHL